MALIICPECGKEISDSAEKCIHCGYPLKRTEPTGNQEPTKKKGKIGLILAIVIPVVVLIIIAIIIGVVVLIKVSNKDVANAEKTRPVLSEVMSNGFTEEEEQVIKFTMNSTQKAENCEFTLTGYRIGQRIEPTNCTETYYHYYEAANGNVYIDVMFKIKNTASSAVEQDSVLRNVKIVYDGTYEYNCFFVTVDKDGDFEGFTSLYDISPLETMEYHMLAEVPSEVKTSGKGIICQVEVDGNTYECTLK